MVMSLVRAPLADATKNDPVVPDAPVPLTAAGAADRNVAHLDVFEALARLANEMTMPVMTVR